MPQGFDLSTMRSVEHKLRSVASKAAVDGDKSPSTFGNGMTNMLYGNNYLNSPLRLMLDKQSHGYVFFSRPQLNMQDRNLAMDSFFHPLLTKSDLSIHRAIRCTLDPRLQWYDGVVTSAGQKLYARCPLIDPCNPFIPMIANTCVSVSGFPDKAVPFYRSPDSLYKANHSMVDGVTYADGAFSLTVNCRNTRGSPVYRLIDYWTEYTSLHLLNHITGYPDLYFGGLLPYNTAIWRLIMDESMMYVEDIAKTGAATPASLPRAQRFDFNTESPLQDLQQQMSFQFECNGFYHGEIVIDEFNRLQECFHPGMRGSGARSTYMQKIPRDLLPIFNCRAYPRIDYVTRELEWYTTKEYYEQITAYTDNILESIMRYAGGLSTVEEITADVPDIAATQLLST